MSRIGEFWRGATRFRVVDGDVSMLNRLRKFGLQNITVSENVVTFTTPRVNRAGVAKMLGKREHTADDNQNALRAVNFFYTRGVLIVSMIVCIVAFFICEQYAFRVNVNGNMTAEERAEVSAYLGQIGISGVTPKSRVRGEGVANDIVGHFPFAALCNISVRGSCITVTVMRAENVAGDINTGDILATADGVVASIVVFSGEARVTRGDVVCIGDVLVTGARPTAIIHIANGAQVVAIIDNTVVK